MGLNLIQKVIQCGGSTVLSTSSRHAGITFWMTLSHYLVQGVQPQWAGLVTGHPVNPKSLSMTSMTS